MFLRTTRRYQEVLESYRHPVTGRPTNRCHARWPLGSTLEDHIAALRKQRLRLQREGYGTERLEKKLTALRRVRSWLRKGGLPTGPRRSYLVHFDGDDAVLTGPARQTLRKVAEGWMRSMRIEVNGYGASSRHMLLFERTSAVQSALIEGGIRRDAISIHISGATDPESKSRVEIVVS